MSTLAGLLSILFISSTIAFSRSLTEQLGPITAATAIFLLSGVLGIASALVAHRELRLLRLPFRYVLVCGFFFVLSSVCQYLAIGLASDRQQVLEVGVINYVWPGLTLVFSIPVLKKRPRLTLLPGIILAFAGVIIAMAPDLTSFWVSFRENVAANWLPYVLAMATAAAWALFSNLSRRLAGPAANGGVPYFFLMTGLVFGAIRLGVSEQSHWQLAIVPEMLYVAIVPYLLAYVLWDLAMRRGNLVLVVSCSFIIPLISTVFSLAYLRVAVSANLLIACSLVIVGAVVCNYSVREREEVRAAAQGGAVARPGG